MIDEIYGQIVVRTLYKGEFGTGVLFQNRQVQYTYFITAWHCLKEDRNIAQNDLKLYRDINGNKEELKFEIMDTVIWSDKDIAIVKIRCKDQIPECLIIRVKENDKVCFSGFPKAMQDGVNKIQRCKFNCEVTRIDNSEMMRLKSDTSFETLESTARDNISGASGSGVFCEIDGKPYLYGIITKLGNNQAAFNFINGIKIESISKYLEQIDFDPFDSIEVSDFSWYKDETLSIIDEPINRICAMQMPYIKTSIYPKDIYEHCGKKLVWPYCKEIASDKEVWKGWLLYLIIRCIENPNNVTNNEFYFRKGKNKKRKIKLMYVINKKTLSEFLKDFLEKAYEDIDENDLLIIKTKEEPSKLLLSTKDIGGIVTNISSTMCTKNEISIDEVKNITKTISLVHIKELVRNLQSVAETESNESLKDEEYIKIIGEKIGGYLDDI